MQDPSSSPVGDSESDLTMLRALRAKDSQAYGELIRTHGPRVRATALRLLRNEADANDVVQETFLSAFRSVDRFEGKAKIATWLHRIAVNAALMRIRSRERHPETDIHDLLPRFTDGGQHEVHHQPFADLPDQVAQREEACALVRECIDKLPDNYRNALLLKDIEEMDYPEVARSLGLTLNATRIRIHRARQALRCLLVPHFGKEAG
jgi:RNA polymerase sigma-70 factor (ECF subfamily)